MTNTKMVVNAKVMEMVKGFDEMKKSEKFDVIQALVVDVLGNDNSIEIADFLQAESERIEKRNSTRNTKPSKKAVAKNEDMETIEQAFATIETDDFYSAKEIQELITEFADYSSQKMTSRLSALVKLGVLEKDKATSDKKKVGYRLAPTVETEKIED